MMKGCKQADPMNAVVRKAGNRPGSAAAPDAFSFEALARLLQRTLDCDAVVLRLGLSAGIPRRQPRAAVRDAEGRPQHRMIAAWRCGRAAMARPELSALTHPLTASEQGMRFFAGLPLRDLHGEPIGMLFAMDRNERILTAGEFAALRQFAIIASNGVMQQIGLAA